MRTLWSLYPRISDSLSLIKNEVIIPCLNILIYLREQGACPKDLSEPGYEPIAHVEMDAAACYTLRTRTAYHWLKKGNNLAPYTKYLAGDIPRKDFYALVPKEILDSVLNYEISEESLHAFLKTLTHYLAVKNLI